MKILGLLGPEQVLVVPQGVPDGYGGPAIVGQQGGGYEAQGGYRGPVGGGAYEQRGGYRGPMESGARAELREQIQQLQMNIITLQANAQANERTQANKVLLR